MCLHCALKGFPHVKERLKLQVILKNGIESSLHLTSSSSKHIWICIRKFLNIWHNLISCRKHRGGNLWFLCCFMLKAWCLNLQIFGWGWQPCIEIQLCGGLGITTTHLEQKQAAYTCPLLNKTLNYIKVDFVVNQSNFHMWLKVF